MTCEKAGRKFTVPNTTSGVAEVAWHCQHSLELSFDRTVNAKQNLNTFAC